MSAAFGLGKILEGSPVVENPAVVDEEHVARLQAERRLETALAQHPIQDIQGPVLFGRQGLASSLVARFNPIAQIPANEPGVVPLQARAIPI